LFREQREGGDSEGSANGESYGSGEGEEEDERVQFVADVELPDYDAIPRKVEDVTSVPTENLSLLNDDGLNYTGPGRRRKNFSAATIKLPMDEPDDKATE
jgi:hypothetical protein